MKSKFEIGLLHQENFTLEAPTTGDTKIGMGFLEKVVSFIESTCCNSLSPLLHSDETTIAKGINIAGDVDYSDYIGSIISVSVELLEFKSNFLAFRVQIDSDSDLVCSGLHVRTLVRKA